MEEDPEAHVQEETFQHKRPPLQPRQKPGLDPHGADKFLEHPRSVAWDDPETQKKWEALIKELEVEGHLERIPNLGSTGMGRSAFRGCLLGLACGDALGTTVEFSPPGTFEPLTDMVGGGVFGLSPGEWTDDTSMALCLAVSLYERGFDAYDQMQRYVRWRSEGYLSVKGYCFDMGGQVNRALDYFVRTNDPYAGLALPEGAGNGSLMRLAPVVLYYADHPEEAISRAEESQ